MSYRGEDLDLRTPQQGRLPRDGYSSSDVGMNGTRHRSPNTSNGRSDAVYVDETVLACCNHAYDVAQAHGANEVRLEHMVHALTRVEAAAEVLEQRGIREAHLRRESAAVIASEIPVGLAHSHSAPRSSVEFEDVLRRASDQARGRGVAASVHDLLYVLLNYNREIPAIALLLRHAADWQSWDWPHQVRENVRPQTVYTERRVYAEPAPAPRQRVVERIVEVQQPEPPRPQVVERIVERPRVEPAPLPQPVVYSQSVNLDPVHNRLDQMDNALRKLQSDLVNERRMMADMVRDMIRESMRDISREIANNRSSGGSLPTGFVDRIENIERTFDQRLGTIEKAVTSGMQEGARNWAALGDRLKVIDKVAASNPNAGLGELVTEQLIAVTAQVQTATEKLESLERNFESRQSENQRTWTSAMDKFRSLEDGLTSSRRDGGTVQSLINERFQTVQQKIEQQNLSTASLVAQLTEPVTDRLRQLETTLTRSIEQSSQRPVDTGAMERIERTVTERLNRLEQAIASGQQTDGQSYQLTSQIGERLKSMEAQPQAIAALTTKLAGLEQLVQSHGDRAVQYTQQVAQQAADAHVRELADLQEAIVKLGSNQQSLSETLDQWRTENEGGISILSNRLEVIEMASAQPVAMLKQLQTDMQAVQQVTIADYDNNRRGFRNWLFGTEDVFAGSWRDETRQIRERLKQMRTDERKA